MRSRGFALGLLGLAAAALVAAPPAAAKDGAEATLRTPIPLDAPAGAHLRVAWTLSYADENGRRRPFGANGVFVRLRSASGAGAATGFVPSGDYATGEYAATVIVPKGGIGDVEIGLLSWSSGPTGTRAGDMLFPITNDPLPGPARVAAPDTGTTTWPFLLAGGLLAVLAAALVLRRRRGGGSASPSPA
jgi:LPXTG-motif cell wall-anchored protein